MNADVKDLVERLRDTDYAGPMQHLRGWPDLDRMHAEAATALEAQAAYIDDVTAEHEAAVKQLMREVEIARDEGEIKYRELAISFVEEVLKFKTLYEISMSGRSPESIEKTKSERDALKAENERLREALTLAANRLDRLALEDMPLKSDATDWGISARAALHPTHGGE